MPFFALWDGEIKDVFDENGVKIAGIMATPDADGVLRVRKGDVLIILEDRKLDDEVKSTQRDLDTYAKEIIAKESMIPSITGRGGDDVYAQLHRIEIEILETKGQIAKAKAAQERLLERKEKKLKVVAPADGIIPDFKRMEILRNRPVKQGDHLFDVMNDNGPWHMELLVAEKRMGSINRAIAEATKEDSNARLKGAFTVVSLPESKFDCELTTVAKRSTIDPEIGTAFELISVAPEGTDIPTQQIGTEVTARFDCGECTLFYWCFGDVVEFVQRNLWWF